MGPESKNLIDLLVRCIDLTSLSEDGSPEAIATLCDRAVAPGGDLPSVAAVCLFPRFVPLARERLAGTGVRVAAAAGAFPGGVASIEERVEAIAGAVAAGAEEIDTVLDHRAVHAGRDGDAMAELSASREACAGRTMKVILETGALGGPDGVRRAARLAMEAGADFVKTSTGKVEPGATPEAAGWMMGAVRDFHAETGRRVGVKVAGGIGRLDQAAEYLAILAGILGPGWMGSDLFRIGASSLLDSVAGAPAS